jgi:hypothetical protein
MSEAQKDSELVVHTEESVDPRPRGDLVNSLRITSNLYRLILKLKKLKVFSKLFFLSFLRSTQPRRKR